MKRTIETMKETPHWSYSAFQTYLACPMKFFFRYIAHAEPERTSVSLPFGRAFHAVLSLRAEKGSDLKKLRRHIADKRVVRMISHIISALIINNHGELTKNRKGTPQGFAISSWLAADLYLDEMDQEMTRRNLRFVRFADDITIFTRSKKSAKRVKARIIEFTENVMECPVNKKKTRIVTIENVSLLGVELRDGHWRILREKVRNHCGEYMKDIAKYKKTKNDYYIRKAAQSMQGFIGGYTRIPDICLRQIRALRRWCMNKWWATGERKLFFAQKRWMVPD